MGIRRPYNFVAGRIPDLPRARLRRPHRRRGRQRLHRHALRLRADHPGLRRAGDQRGRRSSRWHKGFCFSLVQPIQNELDEKLVELIPCAEKVILVKTGSDATTLAIRIARGYTDRNKVLRCGYHGWHDWCVEVHGGVPEQVDAGPDHRVPVRRPGGPGGSSRPTDGDVACDHRHARGPSAGQGR